MRTKQCYIKFLGYFLLISLPSLAMANNDPQLMLNANYKIHIDLQGDKQSGQQVFYNVKDSNNKIILDNTNVVNDSIDYGFSYNVDNISNDTKLPTAINYTLTVYALQAKIGNNMLSMAVPINIKMSANGIHATPVRSYDGVAYSLDYYNVYGGFYSSTLVNKNFITTINDNKNKLWSQVVGDGKAYASFIETDMKLHMRNDINVVVKMPYQTNFMSVEQSAEPTSYDMNYKFQ